MKILTVSASPYLLTNLGRINSSILQFLKSNNYDIQTAVWHLNTNFYLPNEEDGKFKYELENNNIICDLFPFHNNPQQAAPELYDIVKLVEPNVVLSIGDCSEIGFIYALKSMNPNMFKWVNITTIDSLPINENLINIFDYMDHSIFINEEIFNEVANKIPCESSYLPFGPNQIFCPNRKSNNEFNIITNAKNSQSSNLAGILKAFKDFVNTNSETKNSKLYLNTNYSDAGEFNIELLINRFDLKDNVILPQNYQSIHGGLSDEELNNKYNESDVIIDISVKSSTGISTIEAMKTGCIPLCVRSGMLKEIIKKMGSYYTWPLIVGSNTYIGGEEKYLEIASLKDLSENLFKIFEIKKRNYKFFEEISNRSIEISKYYNLNKFLEGILKVIENISNSNKQTLCVEEI